MMQPACPRDGRKEAAMDGDQTRAVRDRTDDDRAGDAARLDGNVVAGMLSEIFVQDFTTARVTCANCGAARPLGALLVHAHGMGMVMRCTTCDSVVMRMARNTHPTLV